MASTRGLNWQAAVLALLLAATSLGLEFNVTNSTSFPGPFIDLTADFQYGQNQSYFVVPLTSAANLSQNQGIVGPSFFANTNNQYLANSSEIVFISCDAADYPGNIQAADVFQNVNNKALPQAIVLYSRVGNWCQPSSNLGTLPVFTMAFWMSSVALAGYVVNQDSNTQTSLGMIIGKDISSANNSSSSSSSNNGSSLPAGMNLTMIILYSITGVVTALFMLIVVAGALKARRHRERYGRQVVGGRVRQTRAGGLAMAMLDTIPIVKFGPRTSQKPADIELGEAGGTHTTDTIKQPEMTERATEPVATTSEDGIEASSNDVATSDDTQGCSICTEDFEIGQDQRVLPCDHRYHPACVDPWLLNVSATCPLCRIDLRPPEEEVQETAEVEQPVSSPTSRRRSALMAITAFRRPERMTREERVEALRQYRRVNTAPATAGAEADASPADDAQIQHRLSRLFNVRTWRTTS